MKKIAIAVLSTLLLICTIATGCNLRPAAFTPGEILYQPRYAAGFAVYEAGEGGGTVLRITDPWQGAEGVEQWVFIPHDGEKAPENFTGTALQGPPRRIICMSSSYTAFLGELGAADRIVGVSGAGFITDSLLAARWRAGDIADVGYEANLDFETIAALKPDLMLIYGIASGDDGVMTGKLREMGVPCVFVGEYLETSPLGRAEWIVALGAMTGLAEGVERFEAIESAYNDLKAEAAALTGRPEVMFNAPYRDVWYVPGDRNYMVEMVRDAGGRYVCRGVDSRDSRPVDIEEAFVAMQRADYWIHTNHYSTLAALLADNPRFAAAPPVVKGRVYNNNARTTPAGGSDFWESGVVRPDLVLRDLMLILHPGELPATSRLYYYKKLQ